MRTHLIPIADIKVDPKNNPRTEVDDVAIKELEESIKSVYELSGTHKTLLQPVVVRPIEDEDYGYELRFGYRRLKAMKNLWTSNPRERPWANKIPAVIDDHDSDDEWQVSSLAFALIENLQREEMSPIDEAMAIELMVKEYSMKQKDVADLLGKSKGWVSQRMKLINLAHEVRAALAEGKIGHAAARQLSKLEDHETQVDLLREGLKEGWQEDDWTKKADVARRGETQAENPSNPEPKKESSAQKETGSLPRKAEAGYTIRRAPAEIKKVQETVEFEGSETDYEAGVSDALLWVLGIGPHPITKELPTEATTTEGD